MQSMIEECSQERRMQNGIVSSRMETMIKMTSQNKECSLYEQYSQQWRQKVSLMSTIKTGECSEDWRMQSLEWIA